MLDREMRYLAVSRRYCTDYLLGPDVDLIGRSHYEVFPEIPERWREIHRRCLAGAVEKCDEEAFPRRDGTVDWVRWEIRPWREATGEVGGIVLFSEVITERKRAEEALRESERKYRALFENLPTGFTLCRAIFEGDRPVDYVHEEVNPAFESHTGLRAADILHRPISEALPGIREDPVGWIELLGGVARTGKPIQYEHPVVPLQRWFQASAYSPRPGYFAVIFLDVTERKKAEASLRDADRLKDEFLSAASHELRTPLATLRLQAQTLSRALSSGRADEPAVRGKLGKIEAQLDRLEALVNTLLDVSRVVAGRLELAPEQLDLAQLARDAVLRFEEAATGSGTELVLRARPAVGRWDRTRLEQVLTNLLQNALRFAPGKPVEISVGERDGRVVLAVRDHGPGIAPESRARIFERFERAAEARSLGGLGLGLWITRQIVEAHGGSISVESAGGAGAVFTVTLPREAP
jgi:PAS domain S-box-containing protein